MNGVCAQTLEVRARDGAPLAATLFAPRGEPIAAVLIAGAMGARRQFYAPFATYLAEHRLAALTVDYRGTGGSRAPGTVRLADWAELDLGGAADMLLARFPRCRLLWVGHSLGGQLFGLLPSLPVARALFVGSQSGSPQHWDGLTRVALTLWHAFVPLVTRATKRVPMRLGRGADVPADVANDWTAWWGRAPGHLARYLRETRGRETFEYRGPLLAYAFTDDIYAPLRAVKALLALYEDAQVTLRVLSPEDVGMHAIGHFGALRRAMRDAWWPEALAFLLWGTTEARTRIVEPLATSHVA